MSIISQDNTSTQQQNSRGVNIDKKAIIPVYKTQKELDTNSQGNIWIEALESEEKTFKVKYKVNPEQVQYVSKNLSGESTDKFILNLPDVDTNKEFVDYWTDKNGNRYTNESIISISEDLTLSPHYTKRSNVQGGEKWDIPPGSGTYAFFGQLVYEKLGGEGGFKILDQHFHITTSNSEEKNKLVNAAPGLFAWTSEYVRRPGSTIGDYSTYTKSKAVRFGSKDIYNPSDCDYYWQDDNISINFELNPSQEILTWTGIKFRKSSPKTIPAGKTKIAQFVNMLVDVVGIGNTKYLKNDITLQVRSSYGNNAIIHAGEPVSVNNYHSSGSDELKSASFIVKFGSGSFFWYEVKDDRVGLINNSNSWYLDITYSDIEFK